MEEWLLIQHGVFLYLGLFFLLLGGSVGLPIPEDIPLILAGIIAQNGRGEIWILFLVCYVGIMIGDLAIYGIGRKFGPSLHNKPWFKSRVSSEKLSSIRRALEKRGILMIFIARHLFYFRTVTFLTCGALGMDFKKFLFADATAALISVPLMMWLGYAGADQYAAMVSTHRENNIFTLIGAFLLLVILAYFFIKRKVKFEDAEDSSST